MQVSDFLLPKDKVAYITSSVSMLEAAEKLQHHHYTAIPIIDLAGKYIGTLSEGDILWKMKETPGLTFENMGSVPITEIRNRFHNECVPIDASMEDMLTLAADQNFIPVIDKNKQFAGIIRRKDIIEYYNRNITD
ncbi:CBS domain-containing protein [Gorillibacterium massiliense]|uniref:CBS domain-containing protein n=1 Tax=Gorillibacterium massiliense TaxID=1280390 RepID=UPI0004B2005A|nr:CBS domain-containing protein [Gorillibacterium massiliense]